MNINVLTFCAHHSIISFCIHQILTVKMEIFASLGISWYNMFILR